MENSIKTFEQFINENFINEGFDKIQFNSHEKHNPDVDILSGYLDKDSYITYGVYIKDTKYAKKGDEFMEYYKGSNYMPDSTEKSSSRMYKVYNGDKIPTKYKNKWEELKSLYSELPTHSIADGFYAPSYKP